MLCLCILLISCTCVYIGVCVCVCFRARVASATRGSGAIGRAKPCTGARRSLAPMTGGAKHSPSHDSYTCRPPKWKTTAIASRTLRWGELPLVPSLLHHHHLRLRLACGLRGDDDPIAARRPRAPPRRSAAPSRRSRGCTRCARIPLHVKPLVGWDRAREIDSLDGSPERVGSTRSCSFSSSFSSSCSFSSNSSFRSCSNRFFAHRRWGSGW